MKVIRGKRNFNANC